MAQMSITLNVTPEEMEVIHTALERLVYYDPKSKKDADLAKRADDLLIAFPRHT